MKDPDTDLPDDQIMVMKPDKETYDKLIETYTSVPYTEDGGWGGTGRGLGCNGMGTSGLLDYYMGDTTNNLPHTGLELDRCIYANDASNECSALEFPEVIGYQMTSEICGQPWMCTYGILEDSWSEATKIMCDTFLIHWVQSREEFDQLYFVRFECQWNVAVLDDWDAITSLTSNVVSFFLSSLYYMPAEPRNQHCNR